MRDARDHPLRGVCSQNGIRSTNETYPLERATEAYERMMSGEARFRVVLTTAG